MKTIRACDGYLRGDGLDCEHPHYTTVNVKRVLVRSYRPLSSGHLALLSIMQELMPLLFVYSPNEVGLAQDIVRFENVKNDGAEGSAPSALTYRISAGRASSAVARVSIEFSTHDYVPFPFRSRSITSQCAILPRTSDVVSYGTTLATCDQRPAWGVLDANGLRHWRCAFFLPTIEEHAVLCDIFHGDHFIELLPLVHFLLQSCERLGYSWPAPSACFMIDDPNLHAVRYGCVDFVDIAKTAAVENYHVSFATVPLDTWYTNQTAAAAFKGNADRISLLIHGNNHTYEELAHAKSPLRRGKLLTQAVHRIERLERRTGIKVSRVMAPPHGACSEEMLANLPSYGFNAATVDHRSLRKYNRDRPWTRSLGFLPCEYVRGCPIVARWGFTAFTENTILLATYLHQPIVLMGHHMDLREGTDLFVATSSQINKLGPIRWTDMSNICESQYQWSLDGDILRIVPWTNRISISVPQLATALVIEDSASGAPRNWTINLGDRTMLHASTGELLILPPKRPSTVSISAAVPPKSPPQCTFMQTADAWPLMRRILTESRDRFVGTLRINRKR